MHHCKLYYPSSDRFGAALHNIRHALKLVVEDKLVRLTGGYTAYKAHGAYAADHGSTVHEAIDVYEFFVASPVVATDLGEEVCRQLNQECVLVVIDGKAFLCRGTSLSAAATGDAAPASPSGETPWSPPIWDDGDP